MANIKWTEEKIIEYINSDENCKFINFINFKGRKSRIIFYCKIHKKNQEICFSNFVQGDRCKECASEKRAKGLIKWTEEKILDYIKENSNDEFIEFIEYKGQLSIIKLGSVRQLCD